MLPYYVVNKVEYVKFCILFMFIYIGRLSYSEQSFINYNNDDNGLFVLAAKSGISTVYSKIAKC